MRCTADLARHVWHRHLTPSLAALAAHRLPPNIDPSKGDWACACGNWNWARRTRCNKCGNDKPRAAEAERPEEEARYPGMHPGMPAPPSGPAGAESSC